MQEARNQYAASTAVERAAVSRPQRAGFTLVELLVVVGLIAVLISMLLPVLSLVRESGQTTKCLSQLRQIGMAISEYANDHNYCMVPGAYGGYMDGSPTPGGGCWADILVVNGYISAPIGYVGFPGDNLANFVQDADTENLLRCPNALDYDVLSFNVPPAPLTSSQTDVHGAMYYAEASDIHLEVVRVWYAINCAKNQNETSNPPLPFNVIPDPVVATAPGGYQNWNLNRITQFHNIDHLPLVFDGMWMFQYDPNRINARHGNNRYTNILFADGHCETQLTTSLPNSDWYLQ